jgi:hypothetical protein
MMPPTATLSWEGLVAGGAVLPELMRVDLRHLPGHDCLRASKETNHRATGYDGNDMETLAGVASASAVACGKRTQIKNDINKNEASNVLSYY